MRSPANPFTDPGQVRESLYVSAGRLARRTSALHRARARGRHAAEVIAELAAGAAVTSAPVIADIGCGRGTTTCLLAERLPQARIIAIDLSAARWKALGLDGFSDPLKLSCSDHNGHGRISVQTWDGTKWLRISDPEPPMVAVTQPLVDAAAKDYVEKNTGWPKRTEACDKSS